MQIKTGTKKPTIHLSEQLPCEFNYYEIRGGKCDFAKVYHGKIFCTNKNCK